MVIIIHYGDIITHGFHRSNGLPMARPFQARSFLAPRPPCLPSDSADSDAAVPSGDSGGPKAWPKMGGETYVE